MIVKVVQNEKELNDAFSVRRTVFIDEQNVPAHLEIDEFENDCTHFVLYDDQTPMGAGRSRVIDGLAKVERICVHSSLRGKGAGKRIMEAIEQNAKQNGITKLKLNAQTHAEPFYKKLGYETISDIFMDAGIPHVTMTKEL